MLEKMSRFYLSKKTFLIAIIAAIILEPIGMIMQIIINQLFPLEMTDLIIPFEMIAYVILFLLLIGLFITRHKEDHILMNGIVSGILIYMFVRYVYLLYFFTGDDALSYYRSAGFLGCFCLAFTFLAVAVVCIIAYNHFTINRSRAVNRTKIILNQFLLFFSFFIPFFFVLMSYLFGYSVYEIITYGVVYLSDAFVFLTVACCELELAMNREDETALEELVPADVKAAIWYTFSFLFSLLCLSMSILLTNAKTFVVVLNNIDLILSLVLLIYYLNKKKKPSPKFRIGLTVGCVATIGLMVFTIGYFICTSLMT